MVCYSVVSRTAKLYVSYAACELFPVMLTQCFWVLIIVHCFEATVQSLEDQKACHGQAYHTCGSLLTVIKHFEFLTQSR